MRYLKDDTGRLLGELRSRAFVAIEGRSGTPILSPSNYLSPIYAEERSSSNSIAQVEVKVVFAE
jgi:hypothetical protein